MRFLFSLFTVFLCCSPNLWGLAKGIKPGKAPKGGSVAIIGAGASGLHLARWLKQNNYKVKIFEKMPRPEHRAKRFGRVLSLNLQGKGVSEMGPIQVGPTHSFTQAYLRELGMEVFEPDDSYVLRAGAKGRSCRVLTPGEEFFPYGRRLDIIEQALRYEKYLWDHFSRYPNLEDVPDDIENNQSFRDFTIKHNLPDMHRISKICTSAYGYGISSKIPAFKVLRMLPSLSALFWVSTDQKPKMIREGFGAFLQAMVDRYELDIHFNQNIDRIYRLGNSVVISTKNGKKWEHFDQLIFACPIDKIIGLLGEEASDQEIELYRNLRYSPYATIAAEIPRLPRGGYILADNLDKHKRLQMISKNSPFDNIAILYMPLESSMTAKDLANEGRSLPTLSEIERQAELDLNNLGLGPVKVLHAERWLDYHPHFNQTDYYRLGASIQGQNHSYYAGTMLAKVDYVNEAFHQAHKLLKEHFEGEFPEPDHSYLSALKWHFGASNLYDDTP